MTARVFSPVQAVHAANTDYPRHDGPNHLARHLPGAGAPRRAALQVQAEEEGGAGEGNVGRAADPADRLGPGGGPETLIFLRIPLPFHCRVATLNRGACCCQAAQLDTIVALSLKAKRATKKVSAKKGDEGGADDELSIGAIAQMVEVCPPGTQSQDTSSYKTTRVV